MSDMMETCVCGQAFPAERIKAHHKTCPGYSEIVLKRVREWKRIRSRPALTFSKPQTFCVLAYDGGPKLLVESWRAHSFAEARARARRITGMADVHLFWTSQHNARKAMMDCVHLRGVPIAL